MSNRSVAFAVVVLVKHGISGLGVSVERLVAVCLGEYIYRASPLCVDYQGRFLNSTSYSSSQFIKSLVEFIVVTYIRNAFQVTPHPRARRSSARAGHSNTGPSLELVKRPLDIAICTSIEPSACRDSFQRKEHHNFGAIKPSIQRCSQCYPPRPHIKHWPPHCCPPIPCIERHNSFQPNYQPEQLCANPVDKPTFHQCYRRPEGRGCGKEWKSFHFQWSARQFNCVPSCKFFMRSKLAKF